MGAAVEAADKASDLPSAGGAEKATSNVVAKLTSKKEPPPEPPASITNRRWILITFWAVVILLGLPVWVWTTTVPRAPLPLQTMNQWASGQACQFEFPLHVAVNAPALRPQDTHQLVRQVQQILDDHDTSALHHLRIAAANQLDKAPVVTVKLISEPEQQEPQVSLLRYEPVLEVRHTALSSSPHTSALTPLANRIASELRSTFDEEQALLTHLLQQAGRPVANARRSAAIAEALTQRSMRSFKYAPTYHLTFSLFTGSATPSAWDIKIALDDNLQPLISSFAAISNFTVDTQVQLFASLPPSMRGPTYDNTTKQWTLERPDLSGFINAAEWPLSPGIGAGPTINFVLYVPSEKQRPLLLKDTGGTSWLIPQWGGVQILNPNAAQIKAGHLTKDDLQPVIAAFADQLVSLLGLPKSPASLPIQLGSLTRERAASVILSASSTLGALSRLTLKLTSIAIPESVSSSVDKTIHHLDQACHCLRNASYTAALEHARIAEAEAEQAFFEPSMVGQNYFPDEHKVAVYVPLLGPVAVPLVLSLVKEIKKLRKPSA